MSSNPLNTPDFVIDELKSLLTKYSESLDKLSFKTTISHKEPNIFHTKVFFNDVSLGVISHHQTYTIIKSTINKVVTKFVKKVFEQGYKIPYKTIQTDIFNKFNIASDLLPYISFTQKRIKNNLCLVLELQSVRRNYSQQYIFKYQTRSGRLLLTNRSERNFRDSISVIRHHLDKLIEIASLVDKKISFFSNKFGVKFSPLDVLEIENIISKKELDDVSFNPSSKKLTLSFIYKGHSLELVSDFNLSNINFES